MDKKPKRPRDPSQLAKMMVDIATSEEVPMVQANRKHVGGVMGGKARAEVLTPRQRSEIAHVAATARWKKPKD